MKYWKRAVGALKDKNSIWVAGLGPKITNRNAHLERAIIRATSHDDTQVDYRSMQRVYAWVRTSPYHLKPLVRALSIRMDKTRSWVVALKGLILMHGVYGCKIPAVRKIGRLPFDLSNFSDAHLKPAKAWGYNAFVRAYFAFLDQKSSFMCSHGGVPERGLPKRLLVLGKSKDARPQQPPLADELETFQNLQSLLDLLIQVKPQANGMRTPPIMEAMDCIIIEIFDVYSIFCTHIARILSRIYDANRHEASLALKVLQQANAQAEELSRFFDFCILLGVLNASEFPKVEQIPEDDMREVQRIVQGISDQKSLNDEDENNNSESCNDKAIVAKPSGDIVLLSSPPSAEGRILTTAVTDKWEIFEDDFNVNGAIANHSATYENVSNTSYMSPASTAFAIVPHNTPYAYSVTPYKQEVPDLISF